MSKKSHYIPPETKTEILRRIKDEGTSVAKVAEEHGVTTRTIYRWLGGTTEGSPTWSEFRKLQKQNLDLIRLAGELSMYLSGPQKKNLYGIQ
jgi:transposase-like protein